MSNTSVAVSPFSPSCDSSVEIANDLGGTESISGALSLAFCAVKAGFEGGYKTPIEELYLADAGLWGNPEMSDEWMEGYREAFERGDGVAYIATQTPDPKSLPLYMQQIRFHEETRAKTEAPNTAPAVS